MRRATDTSKDIIKTVSNFYPRSPCGERPTNRRPIFFGQAISIHALLAESDIMYALKLANTMLFLSTLSLRRATRNKKIYHLPPTNFYPRSPCGERQLRNPSRPGKINFYPRSPCGERPLILAHAMLYAKFLSTLSLRRATTPARISSRLLAISIHALLAESDSAPSITPTASRNFYPRSPCGERQSLRSSY